jgi:hypothetical protein
LGWVLIISGIVQGISLLDARNLPHFWLQLVSVVLSVMVGLLLIRHRGEGLLALTLLLLVYFMIDFEGNFCADDTTFSQLGLGFGQRSRWDIVSSISMGKSSSDSDLAAWRTARYSTYLRRSRSRLFSVAGARQLTLTEVPAIARTDLLLVVTAVLVSASDIVKSTLKTSGMDAVPKAP